MEANIMPTAPNPALGEGSNSIFSSPERKAQRELERASICASVREFVRASTLSNMNMSETSWTMVIKFHLEHHWGGGLTALGFGLDRIRTHGFHGNR